MKDNPVSVNVSDAEDYYLHEGDLLFVRTGGTTGKVYRYEDGDGLLVYAGFLIRFSVDLKDYDDYLQEVHPNRNDGSGPGWQSS